MTPLAGITVLDLTRLLPGGFCSLLLADFGAEVIKVEDTAAGDYARWMEPRLESDDSSTASPSFIALNRNKRSIRLDLKQDAGRDALLRLAGTADVVLESFRPGVMDRLGVGYDALRAVNPRLVYCAITGYGQDGVARTRAGHDMNYLAAAGVLALSGEAGGRPAMAGAQIADVGGGALYAAFSILAALRARDASGEGQLVDVSMTHGALSFLTLVAADTLAFGRPARRGEQLLNGGVACYRPYACADGWVTVGALEPKFWRAWCGGVGRDDLVEHQFAKPGSDAVAEIASVFAARTREQWEAFNAEHDCCVAAVSELEETLGSTLVGERELLLDVDQPGIADPVTVLGSPVKLAGAVTARPAPALGEHTVEVLFAAGFDPDEIQTLLASGAARAADATLDPS